jgi:hypothetical protein
MRTGIMLAWLTGMGIIGYQSVARAHHAPLAGQFIGASGLFGLLALASEYQPAAGVAALLAWGFDLAALLNALPGGLGGTKKGTEPKVPLGGIYPTPSGKPRPNITGSTGQG